MVSKSEYIDHEVDTESTRQGWFNAWMKFFEKNTPSDTTEDEKISSMTDAELDIEVCER